MTGYRRLTRRVRTFSRPVPLYFGPNIYRPFERGSIPFAFKLALAVNPIRFPALYFRSICLFRRVGLYPPL